jgi:beta-glucosidase
MGDGHPREMITTVLDGVRRFADVSYARGADILTVGTDPAGAFFPDGQPRPQVVLPSAPSEELIAEAVAVAESSDAVVAVVGDQIELVGEGRSTATLELVGGQNALLDALIETGKPVIVVVIASKPLVLPASVQRAAGVVWAANPGMRGGQPISFARHAGQQPTYYNQLRGQHGDRYADLTQSPAWAFGEGLSYTTVSYDRVVLASSSLAPDDTIVADVTVSNTGSRPVRETVQVYVRDEVTSVSWTDKELKAHTQVDLAPGETRTVRIELPVAECTIVDAAGNRVVEAGGFALLVGPSSRDEALLQVPFEVK